MFLPWSHTHIYPDQPDLLPWIATLPSFHTNLHAFTSQQENLFFTLKWLSHWLLTTEHCIYHSYTHYILCIIFYFTFTKKNIVLSNAFSFNALPVVMLPVLQCQLFHNKMYIIGCREGGSLLFSVEDNEVPLDIIQPLLQLSVLEERQAQNNISISMISAGSSEKAKTKSDPIISHYFSQLQNQNW